MPAKTRSGNNHGIHAFHDRHHRPDDRHDVGKLPSTPRVRSPAGASRPSPSPPSFPPTSTTTRLTKMATPCPSRLRASPRMRMSLSRSLMPTTTLPTMPMVKTTSPTILPQGTLLPPRARKRPKPSRIPSRSLKTNQTKPRPRKSPMMLMNRMWPRILTNPKNLRLRIRLPPSPKHYTRATPSVSLTQNGNAARV